MDSTFETMAVGNFRNDGKNYILGVTTEKNVIISGAFRKDIRMISYNGNSFAKVWDYIDSTTSFLSNSITIYSFQLVFYINDLIFWPLSPAKYKKYRSKRRRQE